jgi:hypothetical protein
MRPELGGDFITEGRALKQPILAITAATSYP